MTDVNDGRLQKQIAFIMEIDKMKTTLRQSLVADGSRRENDAEHSWHMAVMASVLCEYAGADGAVVNIPRVIKMALVHDLVEIYAGDTFAYDVEGNESKALRETAAADKLYAALPEDQAREYRGLWEEFDAAVTDDAKYAAAIDRLQPLLANIATNGHTWKKYGVASDRVLERMEAIRTGAPRLWPFVLTLVERAIEAGFLDK